MDHCPIPDLTAPEQLRLWKSIDRKSIDLCWPWLAYCNKKGYGIISIRDKKLCVTRVMYKLAFGIDPDQLLVCHECHNPACCNPKHLYLGTDQENAVDRELAGRRCVKGELHTRAKLTAKQVMEIRSLEGEVSAQDLAKKNNIHLITVYKIWRRQTWKDL